jgi:hypothetical protein
MFEIVIESAMINPPKKEANLVARVRDELLNQEWIQLRNVDNHPVVLDGISLNHVIYLMGGDQKHSLVMNLQGSLPGGSSIRIHTGAGVPTFDKARNVYHAYISSKRFMFQVSKPDNLFLEKNGKMVDYASYKAPVKVGIRLKRKGNTLIP